MAAQHTPGPWTFKLSSVTASAPAGERWPVHIAHICANHVQPHHRFKSKITRVIGSVDIANAHLIAAAPELLDLAKLFERVANHEVKLAVAAGDSEAANLRGLTLAQVRAVIAKAEGRGDGEPKPEDMDPR